MPYSPILAIHICAGTLGLLSGTAAMSFRKGSPRHALAGKVFVISMLTMGGAAAIYLAIVKHQPNNGETSRFDCDGNAAINLKQNTVGYTGINAWGQEGSGLAGTASETGLVEPGTLQE